jgi:hypothetical protein
LIPLLHQLGDLSVNELLLSGLFRSEPLLHFGLLQMLKGIPLFLIFYNFILFLLFFDSNLLLDLYKFVIRILEFLPCFGYLLGLIQVFKHLPLYLLFNLLLNKLTL